MRLLRSYHSEFLDRRKAFSLIELMVAVSLTVFIVIVLYAVFNQTQKALRAAVKQVSVQDLGAPALELISAELETALAFAPFDPNGTNLEIRVSPLQAFVQVDTDGEPVRTNVVQDLWFLRRDKQMWVPTMYRLTDLVLTNDVGQTFRMQAGTLTRFTTNYHAATLLQNNDLLTNFYSMSGQPLESVWPQSLVSKVAERVVHFKITAVDAQGRPYSFQAPTNYSTTVDGQYRYYSTDSARGSSNVITRAAARENVPSPASGSTFLDEVWFTGRAMPAAIEIEIGIVEPETYDQYRLIASDNTERELAFLRTRPHAVHIFKKRISIPSGQSDERLVFSK